jgi:hypothetical protein
MSVGSQGVAIHPPHGGGKTGHECSYGFVLVSPISWTLQVGSCVFPLCTVVHICREKAVLIHWLSLGSGKKK